MEAIVILVAVFSALCGIFALLGALAEWLTEIESDEWERARFRGLDT